MFVDARWAALALIFALVFLMARRRKDLSEPLVTAVVICTLLATLLFFIPVPVVVFGR
ncbi:hypothetical protein O7614_03415 [Micromonospora sp. WMMD961]|uniref:hypothetical protein n=1 Tax=Micromonospora sp. WMMD961 TaxID=3016100 RepID=UPI002415E668|nr:hypothetical protein [Micromonospora sp. WMMD961]MDG4778695.1 hypothetical protein [Micromonospora sp. WMMD961]